ncbi:Beta-hexosaminidase 1 isoform 1 [Hibiscus syriacus]|uniref:Beta-hexosaminidase 1 isoform 1 n=1 Tax=Hibiscus syriacus TaxID=106335 RepID=A0A6A2X4C5_HIBSY|nr:Beta-hexosaminidase 1 isoform 1 [Hibiscus syriacus]
MFWRSASWSASQTNGQIPLTEDRDLGEVPKPLSIARSSLYEWPKASSDDLGEWPQPPTPSENKIEYFKADFVYRTLWLQDSPSEDITSKLYDVFDYFEDVKELGGRTFVHCCQGVSMSTSLVIAYLMWREGQSFDDAFEYVKAAGGIADPNMGFACQLLQCQKRVHAFLLSPSSLLRMYRIAAHSPYDPLHLVPKMLNDPSPLGLDSRGTDNSYKGRRRTSSHHKSNSMEIGSVDRTSQPCSQSASSPLQKVSPSLAERRGSLSKSLKLLVVSDNRGGGNGVDILIQDSSLKISPGRPANAADSRDMNSAFVKTCESPENLPRDGLASPVPNRMEESIFACPGVLQPLVCHWPSIE